MAGTFFVGKRCHPSRCALSMWRRLLIVTHLVEIIMGLLSDIRYLFFKDFRTYVTEASDLKYKKIKLACKGIALNEGKFSDHRQIQSSSATGILIARERGALRDKFAPVSVDQISNSCMIWGRSSSRFCFYQSG
jgi:hypothetical protein